jgi:uncharacterized protein (DUF927 family)/5S rRNA maturation endonuclease (ribonuclease M5)
MNKKYECDFFQEARDLIDQRGKLNFIQDLLPDGKIQGNEYLTKNPRRNDAKVGSFSINHKTGKWSDFAIGEQGNDLISLYAYIKGISSTEACYEIGVPRYTKDSDALSVPELCTIENLSTYYSKKWHTRSNALDKNYSVTIYHYLDAKGDPVGVIIRGDSDGKKAFSKLGWNGKAWHGKSQWLGEKHPLYRLTEVNQKKKKKVLIVEGEKTVESAQKLFPEYVVTTSAMGSNQDIGKTDWSVLKDREVVICRDYDEAGAKYEQAVIKKLANMAKTISTMDVASIGSKTVVDGVLTDRTYKIPKGYDLADSFSDGYTAQLIKRKVVVNQVELDQEEKDVDFFSFPKFDYKLTKTELFFKLKKDDEYRKLCNYIRPIYDVKDADKESGIIVHVRNNKNELIERWISRRSLVKGSESFEEITCLYIKIQGEDILENRALRHFLNQIEPTREAMGVTKCGWHGDGDQKVYLLPLKDHERHCFAPDDYNGTEYILQQQGATNRSITHKGTLKNWQNTVGKVIKGNHVHSFAVIASLSSPVLDIIDGEGGFFHFAGETGSGKSTVLKIANALWGHHDLGSFRTTDNALENTGREHNHGTLFLDELGQSTAEAASQSIYLIGNGKPRSRANKFGGTRKDYSFKTLALSSGELGIEALLRQKNMRAKGGQLLRMGEINVHRKYGSFDRINLNPLSGVKFNTAQEQAKFLEEHSRKNQGMVIDAFLKKLTQNYSTHREELKDIQDLFLKHPKNQGYSDTVTRMITRLSFVFSAGILASRMNVINLTEEEIEACIDTIFQSWLDRRGGDGSHEMKEMINKVKELCVIHKDTRFTDWDDVDAKVNNNQGRAGYFRKNLNGEPVFLIYPKVFNEEILEDRDSKQYLPLFVEQGFLKPNVKNERTHVIKTKDNIVTRFYIVPISAFAEEDSKEPTEEKNQKKTKTRPYSEKFNKLREHIAQSDASKDWQQVSKDMEQLEQSSDPNLATLLQDNDWTNEDVFSIRGVIMEMKGSDIDPDSVTEDELVLDDSKTRRPLRKADIQSSDELTLLWEV